MPDYKIITPATVDVATIDQIRDHLNIDVTSWDTKLMMFLDVATADYQIATGRTLHQTTYEAALSGWPCDGNCYLPMAAPLISIDSVNYYDSTSSATVWPSTDYEVNTYSLPGYFSAGYGISYPNFTARMINPIIVRYTAGIPNTPSQVPAEEIDRNAILEMIASMFANRESISVFDRASASAYAKNPTTERVISFRRVAYAF